MYTREDLKKSFVEVEEKIATTEITEEVFAEIESELRELSGKRDIVVQQVHSLVEQANDMCLLYKQIQGSVNSLYSELKAKKLKDEGVDLSIPSNQYKYNLHLSHGLTYGGGFKVEIKKTA